MRSFTRFKIKFKFPVSLSYREISTAYLVIDMRQAFSLHFLFDFRTFRFDFRYKWLVRHSIFVVSETLMNELV